MPHRKNERTKERRTGRKKEKVEKQRCDHFCWDWATPRHIGTGLAPSHICTGTGLSSATSAPGLGLTVATSAPGLGFPLPHPHRDWAFLCHICAGTGLSSATSAPGRCSPRSQMAPCPHACWSATTGVPG
jgi:hypothetical protein